jgi:hypothetical protein
MRADTVGSVMGGASAIGGFLLVFLGLVISVAGGYEASTPQEVLKPYRFAGKLALTAFVLGLLTVVASVLWMTSDPMDWLYWPIVVAFLAELAAALILAFYVTAKILFSD